jgi:hypothetical protein
VLCVVGVVAAVFALVPSHGGPAKGVQVAPRTPVFGQTTAPVLPDAESPAAAGARTSAERIVRPLARRFVDDLLRRRDLPFAYSLLGPELRKGYSLHDWQSGRLIPLSASGSGASIVIAFSGGSTVGTVSSIGPNALFAVRFDETNGRWLVDYVHQGHSSRYVDDLNYAPPGFLPGGHTETLWTLLALVGGFLAIVAVAVFFEAWLRDSRASSSA